ncbi:MAG: hypothetical protein HQK63_16485 [Desulfamplus sp.]|nr:hypothetical protein [Desulfamplus sp.]
MKKGIKCFSNCFIVVFIFTLFAMPQVYAGDCQTEEVIIHHEYLGACDHTDISYFTLTKDTNITKIRIWFDTSMAGGIDKDSIFVFLSGPDGYSNSALITSNGQCQGSWCEGIWNIDQMLKAGDYELFDENISMCANPSGDTTLILYGCDIEEQLPDDSSVNLTEGLVAYYPFNGNANDESGNGNNGTVTGATLTSDKNGIENSAYSFDGTNDYCLFEPEDKLNLDDALTISAWINPKNPSSYYNHIVDKSNQWAFSLIGSELQVALVGVIPNSWWNTGILLSETTGNKWYHVVVTYDNSLMKNQVLVYVDGFESASLTVALALPLVNTTYKLAIGTQGQNPGQTLFHGDIDEVRIYNRALSESEIQKIYNSGSESPEELPPTVQTKTANSVTATSATINGTVNPNGSATSYYFQYGTSTNYGSVTATADAGSGSTDKTVSANLTGLTANTTYHFRLVAKNSAGTTNGSDQTFKTLENGLTEGLEPPDGISVVDDTSTPSDAPVYMGNIVTTGNVPTLNGMMELSVDFPAYSKPVDIWILIALPDGRFYLADSSGKLLDFNIVVKLLQSVNAHIKRKCFCKRIDGISRPVLHF